MRMPPFYPFALTFVVFVMRVRGNVELRVADAIRSPVSVAKLSELRGLEIAESITRASTPRLSLASLSSLPQALQTYLQDLHEGLALSSGRLNSSAQNAQECMIFGLAYEYALRLLPARAPNLDIWNALMLGPNCGASPPPSAEEMRLAKPWPPSTFHTPNTAELATVFYVSPTGSDSNDGSVASPFATIARALAATRAARPPGQGAASIVLRVGVHVLGSTIELDSRDQFLTVTNYPGEAAWVSGGAVLSNFNWEAVNVTEGGANVYSSPIPSPPKFMTGLLTVAADGSPSKRLFRAQFPNFNPEWHSTGVCDHTRAPECAERMQTSPFLQTHYARMTKIERGEEVRKDLPRFPEIIGIDYKDNGLLSWQKPALFPRPETFYHDLKGLGLKNNSAMHNYNLFSTGRGGACGLWTNFWSEDSSYGWDYHCGNVTDGGWEEVDELMQTFGVLNMPVGLVYDSTVLSNLANWKLNLDPTQRVNGASIVNVWMTQGWFNNFLYITNQSVINATAGVLSLYDDDGVYPAGGWQGGRHWQTQDSFTTGGHIGPLLGGTWSVSNVFQELDSYDEYYYDPSSETLYVYYNASENESGTAQAPPPSGLVLMAPQLEVFFNISSGASDISITGLGFRDQRVSVLDPWTVPSGGDWGLRPYGAINLRNTERVTLSNLLFQRTDSNAIFIGGRNRNTSILDSECVWLGMNCVASLGETVQDDATGGDQPWGTLISGLVAHELALYEKQSSAYFVGRTPLSRVENCLFYNGPRAMINVNDHLGGANNFTTSLLFNTCRESGDHGAMNSWHRMPFLSDISSVEGASYYPALSETHGVFGIANYGSAQAYDNDDGSSFDLTHDNFFALADGFKMDYGGSDSIFHSNVVIVRPYDGQNCFNMWSFVPGHQDTLYNNTCAIWPNMGVGNPKDADMVLSQNDCGACDTDRSATPHFHDNHFYTTHGNASAACGTTVADLRSRFPAYEAGSTWTTLPTPAQVIQWGRDVLNM